MSLISHSPRASRAQNQQANPIGSCDSSTAVSSWQLTPHWQEQVQGGPAIRLVLPANACQPTRNRLARRAGPERQLGGFGGKHARTTGKEECRDHLGESTGLPEVRQCLMSPLWQRQPSSPASGGGGEREAALGGAPKINKSPFPLPKGQDSQSLPLGQTSNPLHFHRPPPSLFVVYPRRALSPLPSFCSPIFLPSTSTQNPCSSSQNRQDA